MAGKPERTLEVSGVMSSRTRWLMDASVHSENSYKDHLIINIVETN
jgi:hypothetical protein